ncbi:MAG TPA: hypothetical protein EYO31_06605 [Phycisphaerales bacterium]|nr:hypothetical protein [Phycisphaerales bacterium]
MRVKVGDLVRMKLGMYDSDLVGIVLEVYQAMTNKPAGGVQIGIKWFGGSGKMDWEPEPWLEVVSESR